MVSDIISRAKANVPRITLLTGDNSFGADGLALGAALELECTAVKR